MLAYQPIYIHSIPVKVMKKNLSCFFFLVLGTNHLKFAFVPALSEYHLFLGKMLYELTHFYLFTGKMKAECNKLNNEWKVSYV